MESTPFPSPSSTPAIGWTWQRLALNGALIILLWLGMAAFPAIPTSATDPSWRAILSEARIHGWQFGTEVNFTYGPLGYLFAPAFAAPLLMEHVAWQILGNLFLVLVLWRVGARLSGWRQAAYYVYLLFLGTSYPDSALLFAISGLALELADAGVLSRSRLIGGATLLALLALVKFTALMLIVLSGAVVIASHAVRRRVADGVLFALTGATAFLLLWTAAGQALRNLVPYIRNSWEVSAGYVVSMGLPTPTPTFFLGVVTGALLAGAALIDLTFARRRPRTIAGLVLLGGLVFMSWKHGFVRSDGHVFSHYLACMFAALAWPLFVPEALPSNWRRLSNGLLAAVVISALAGIHQVFPLTFPQSVGVWNTNARTNLEELVNLPDTVSRRTASLEALSEDLRFRKLNALIGRESVDHLGNDQGRTILNGLNYFPRPALQSYAAYTPRLLELDERHYLGATAPRFVVQSLEQLDNRFPGLEDAPTLKVLYQNFDFVAEEHGYALWEHSGQADKPSEAAEPWLDAKTISFDENVPVPPGDGRPVWASVDLQPNLWGRIRQFFYKPPPVFLKAIYQDGEAEEFSLVPGIASVGFIVDPLFRTVDDIRTFQGGGVPRRRVRAFAITTDGVADHRYFKPAMTVRFRSLEPFKRSADGLTVRSPRKFTMASQPPSVLRSLGPASRLDVDGRDVLFVHAPSELVFAASGRITAIHADYGLVPGAYESSETDLSAAQVRFRIEYQGASGNTAVLHEQLLMPRVEARDRGNHEVKLEGLDLPAGGQVRFLASPGPSGSTAYAWSYWTAIVLTTEDTRN